MLQEALKEWKQKITACQCKDRFRNCIQYARTQKQKYEQALMMIHDDAKRSRQSLQLLATSFHVSLRSIWYKIW